MSFSESKQYLLAFVPRSLRLLWRRVCRTEEARIRAELLAKMMRRTPDLGALLDLIQSRRLRRAVPPVLIDRPVGKRLLVIAPHQDDDTIGCGGVCLKAIAAGARVRIVYLTDGANPRWRGSKREQYIATRKGEAVNVCRRLGAESPIFLDLPCQNVPLEQDTVKLICQEIESFKPDCLFVPFFLEDVDDHRKVSHLLWLAGAESFPKDLEIWAYRITAAHCPNVAVEIGDVADKKDELMKMWQSQNQNFDYSFLSKGQDIANGIYVKGIVKNNPHPIVEVFFVCSLPEYLNLIGDYFKDNSLDVYTKKPN